MEIKKEIKTITREEITYIAEDGKKFYTEYDCEKHEEKLKKEREQNKRIEKATKLELTELVDVIPLDVDGMVNDNNYFKWYKLNSDEDFWAIEKAYHNNFTPPIEYPVIVCIESYQPYDVHEDAYAYWLPDIIGDTKKFFEKFGYDVKFKKVKEN